MHEITAPAVLRIRDVGFPKELGKYSLVPLVCPTAGASNLYVQILSNSSLKTLFAINSFALKGGPVSLVPVFLFELSS